MKYTLVFVLFLNIFYPAKVYSQGKNHNWLIGNDLAFFDTNVTSTKARFNYD